MSLPRETDILVIGAGPAGLAAATVLAPSARVLVLDRETSAGGIPRHCGHYPFGLREFRRLLKGPAYAQTLVRRAQAAGVHVATGVNVVSLLPGPRVAVTSNAGITEIDAKLVLLATGVRESSRAQRLIGGEKPGGVMSTGALQGLVYLEGRRPFRRPVILGTELVSFSAIMTCAHAGIRPVAMIEPDPRVTARWPAAVYPHLKGIPLHLSTVITSIEGRERVERVVIKGPKGESTIEADGVIVSGRFRPEATLLDGSDLIRDPATGGPVIDSFGRCSDPSYFAAGNLLRPVETAGWSWAEGVAVGQAMRAALAGRLPQGDTYEVKLIGEALDWVVPQRVTGPDAVAFDRLQLRVTRSVAGRLTVKVGGSEYASRRIDTRPERRITVPLPPRAGAVEIVLEEE
ncbi:NAD(P)/FAD-dependent oxidoreductase [Aestuariivirga sp. YIM B02566]|uniref:NAD(P)/FAD-dependent oxidoreductase n=1 Tax=Taklimakanibacter albus TaxID=2800327 RepID=A0ACC5R6A7_9HYPH|nr:FAD/NAD(P)-binding oxidoreductase [Aestuariivirga sp. YIM B02566]MBK1868162.1 NAD(P)/FAD-dependent oxidoreductase [Aestuariivirga sp. YIM B02566]